MGGKRRHLVIDDYIGKRNGGILILGRGSNFKLALVQCECGKIYEVESTFARDGNGHWCRDCTDIRRRVCPEFSAEVNSRFQGVLKEMQNRCYNPQHPRYSRYGGRGITVYDEWRNDLAKFIRYVTTLPGWDIRTNEIDRIDNNLGYIPGNLRFVSTKENNRNRSSNIRLEHRGKNMCVMEFYERFAKDYGTYDSVRYAITHGKTPEQIISEIPTRVALGLNKPKHRKKRKTL